MTRLRSRLQHRLNPLHIYCRLRTLGLTHSVATAMSRYYEHILYRRMLA
ncbi:hypothetical protein [Pseudodesulfovibrio sediminis]|uniref:Uncharacterized protein n=1 Tax=Pseudodesulfovibrio sediminis TaxID=2810563 RepID=A0ABM8HZ11_9BACT|nr:hypothetical protein [Pseudodesulfovibrio sediminis]BCS88211.1 hypothetical protein PSDVSF_14530 [Pseudodesulfovibrio sediminis]